MIISLLINLVYTKYIVVPLTKYDFSELNYSEPNKMLNYISQNVLYSKITLNENKEIITFINSTYSNSFDICNKCCRNDILENETLMKVDFRTNQILEQNKKNKKIRYRDYQYELVNDSISFYNSLELNKEIELNNFTYYYNSEDDSMILDDMTDEDLKKLRLTCGTIGLTIGYETQRNGMHNFIMQLRSKKIIDESIFTIIKTNKNNNIDYFLLIGQELHDIFKEKKSYNYIDKNYNKFLEINKLGSYVRTDGYFSKWEINFDEIYENNKNFSERNIKASLEMDFNLIQGTFNYLEYIENNFFNEYIQQNKCFKQKVFANYNTRIYFYCIKDEALIQKFKNIYFKQHDFNYIFELNYKDIFTEINNKYFFNIIFDYQNKEKWKMGKIFLDKYLFSYNLDNKMIFFYKPNIDDIKEIINNDFINNKKLINNKTKILGIFIIGSISIFSIVFYFTKKYYTAKKKENSNELENFVNI